jgi:CRISPR-associated protein Cas1
MQTSETHPSKTLTKKRIRLEELPAETITNIVALRDKGATFREIAVGLGLAHASVMRLYKHKTNGVALDLAPRMPKRPRSGQASAPDFARPAKLTAKGKTVKEVWRDYAKETAKPYCYTHFSTLFRVWLEEHKQDCLRKARASDTNAGLASIPDYTADEDEIAEHYWRDRIDPCSALHVLNGDGCSVKVQRGDLVTFDGEERRFSKVTHGLRAIAFLGNSGFLTLDAIKWCEAQSVGLFVLGWHGELISVTQASLVGNLDLRRAQFRADRFPVAKAILLQKLQSEVRIKKLSQQAHRNALTRIKTARTVDELFPIEAQAALDYWANWNFELKHKKRNWPDQWTHFSYRASPVKGGPRHAIHPVNAILNYAYAVAAAQITRTLQAFGRDSLAGFMHADDNGRQSLSYDLLELLRTDIDNAILPWVQSHIWKRPDFPVTPEGLVRLQPTLAAVVAQKAMLLQKVVDQAVEWLKSSL